MKKILDEVKQWRKPKKVSLLMFTSILLIVCTGTIYSSYNDDNYVKQTERTKKKSKVKKEIKNDSSPSDSDKKAQSQSIEPPVEETKTQSENLTVNQEIQQSKQEEIDDKENNVVVPPISNNDNSNASGGSTPPPPTCDHLDDSKWIGNSGIIFATKQEADYWANEQAWDPNSKWYLMGNYVWSSGTSDCLGERWTVDFY